jgi:hypothetical protein
VVLSHVEHLKSISEALTRAVDTYMAGHNASQAESEHGWREDLVVNVQDAVDEFHRSLSEAPRRTLDIYLAEDKEQGGGRSTPRTQPRTEPPARPKPETPSSPR